MERKFDITLRSRYPELWRYNIVLTCGCFNAEGERIDFLSKESNIAPVGANLAEPPKEAMQSRDIEVKTPPCSNIVLYIYIIPHTLPTTREVEEYAPFDFSIKVTAGKEEIYSVVHKVNQWSGASIELKLPQAK